MVLGRLRGDLVPVCWVGEGRCIPCAPGKQQWAFSILLFLSGRLLCRLWTSVSVLMLPERPFPFCYSFISL